MNVSVESYDYFRRIAENLLEFQRSGDFCDVIVQLQGSVELSAHSAVLAATSPPLRELLATSKGDHPSDPRRNVIRLEGYDVDVARPWLEFVYTGRCQLDSEKQLAEVRALCEALKMPEPVSEACQEEPVLLASPEPVNHGSPEPVDPGRQSSSLMHEEPDVISASNEGSLIYRYSESLGLTIIEKASECENSNEPQIIEFDGQEIKAEDSVVSSNASTMAESMVIEWMTNDKPEPGTQSEVIPQNDDIGDRNSTLTGIGCNSKSTSPRVSCSVSQVVHTLLPVTSTSNGISVSEAVYTNERFNNPVATRMPDLLPDMATRPLLNGCQIKCLSCGSTQFVATNDNKSSDAKTVLSDVKCLSCGEPILKPNSQEVGNPPRKSVQKVSQRRLHMCSLCNRAFGTHSGLFGHLAKHPVLLLSETYCGICRSSFTSASEFFNHVIIFGGSDQNLRSARSGNQKLSDDSVKVSGNDKNSGGKGRSRKPTIVKTKSEYSNNVKLELKMGSHKCPICLEAFWTHASLYRHTSHHEFLHITNDRLPMCGICQTTYDDTSQLIAHITSKAGHAALPKTDDILTTDVKKEMLAPEVLECGFCGRMFGNKSGLQSHISVHLNGRPHKCPSCGDSFRFSKHLASHARMFHNIFVCSKCGSNCTCTLDETKALQLADENPKVKSKSFTCPECPKIFRSRRGLLNHKSTHSPNIFVCETCGLIFSRRDHLTSHKFMHVSKPHPCTFCDKYFLSAARLEEHTRVHTGESPIVCSHCGQHFKARNALRVHLVSKHSNLHRLKVAVNKCNFCRRQFSSKAYLTIHVKRHYGKPPAFKCQSCSKCFHDVYSLRKHAAVHTGSRERSFLCCTCNKGFTSRGNLRHHMASHREEKVYFCAYCNKGFKYKSNLSKHWKAHCKYDPYSSIAFARADGDLEFTCKEEVVLDE